MNHKLNGIDVLKVFFALFLLVFLTMGVILLIPPTMNSSLSSADINKLDKKELEIALNYRYRRLYSGNSYNTEQQQLIWQDVYDAQKELRILQQDKDSKMEAFHQQVFINQKLRQ